METRTGTLVRDLGTGFGTPANLARLAAGQRQKRQVLLRMLLNDAAAVEGSGLAEAAPHITGEMLDYPNVGVWLVRCIRRMAHPDGHDDVPLWADLGYLGWLRAAAFVTARQAGSVEVVVRDGAVMLPGLGLARLGPPGTHGHATLTGRFEFTMGDTRLVVRDPGGEGDERWLPLRRLGATYSALRTVHLDDLDPFRDFSDPYTKAQLTARPPRLTAAQAAQWSRNFVGALEILRRRHEGYSTGIDEVLRTVVPLTAEPVANGVSNTSLHAYGGVNMSAAGGPQQFALTLIHECQHAKLTALSDQAELQKPSTVTDLYAPWRDDPRPLTGLLQGIYAHIGVTDFWRVYRHEAGPKAPMAEVEFARWRTQVQQALLVAAASPLLTEAGTTFVAAMQAAIRHWSGETVPARLETLARESSAGHLVAWRVRNMTVNVDDLRSRWSRGLDAGELPPSRVVPGDVPLRGRLPVGYLKMNQAAGVEPGPDVPAADLAYVEGDYERALALYTAETPPSPETWAGLALSLRQLSDEQTVSALFQRPEVVAALHRVVQGDLVQLTMWLSA